MRVVGPNCLGVLNSDPAISLNATFAPGTAPAGSVAFASQSGGFGIAAIDLVAERSLGLSSFVSAGDKADLFRQRLPSVLGDRRAHRARSSCTSSRSGIRASSARSRGA
jgi:hypothetical protein